MATTADVTTFYYEIPKLIQKINTKVEYSIRNRTEKPKGFGDNSIIDADMLVGEYITQIANDLFDKHISKLGRAVVSDLEVPQEPFEYGVDYILNEGEIDEDTLEDCIVYRVILPEKFDTTTIPPIFKAIEDSIISYAVYQWLMDSNVNGWQIYEDRHEKDVDKLIGLVNRRIGLVRTYKLY